MIQQDLFKTMQNLSVSIYALGNQSAREFVTSHGIKFQYAFGNSMVECWEFWNCTDVPDPLPDGMRASWPDPLSRVGYGLSKETADRLVASRKFYEATN